MAENESSKEDHLFVYLVTMFSESAWIAMGKLKNPATDKLEKSLEGARLYIDLLDMIKERTKGNLSGHQDKFLDSTISSLKLNYMEVERETEKEGAESEQEEGEKEPDEDEEEDQKEEEDSEDGGTEDDEKKKDD